MGDLSQTDISNIDRMFDELDIDHDGEISINELTNGELRIENVFTEVWHRNGKEGNKGVFRDVLKVW